MKSKQLLAVAMCSAVAFVSCEKANENAPVIGDGEPIDLVMKLGSGADTRSLQGGVSAGLTPVLGNGIVFFYGSNGAIWGHEEIIPTDIQDEDGQLFTAVDGKSTDVYIVANLPTGAETTLESVTTIANLKAMLLDLKTQNGDAFAATDVFMSNVVSNLNPEYDGVIRKGTDNYEAKVALRPVLSRLQLADIKTNDSNIKSFKLAGVYVDNYYPNFSPSTTENVSAALKTVGINASLLGGSDYFLFDEPNSPVAAVDNKVGASDLGDAGDVFAYHVTPHNNTSGNNNYVPSLIIKLTDIVYTDDNNDTHTIDVGYITVSHYKKGTDEILNFEPGNVYSIPSDSFVFDLENIADTPNIDDVDLSVYVTVEPWVVNPVTPVL